MVTFLFTVDLAISTFLCITGLLVNSVRGIVLNRVKKWGQIHKGEQTHEITKRGCEGKEHANYVVSTGHPGGGSN